MKYEMREFQWVEGSGIPDEPISVKFNEWVADKDIFIESINTIKGKNSYGNHVETMFVLYQKLNND